MSVPEDFRDPGAVIAAVALGENPIAGGPFEKHPHEESDTYYSKNPDFSDSTVSRQDSSDSQALIVDPAKLPTYYAATRLSGVIIMLSLAFGIYAPSNTELLKMRVCEEGLQISKNICDHINEAKYKIEGDAVRTQTAQYQLYNTLIGSLPSIIFSVFVGSWSDRFGRKLPMLLPFIGMFVGAAFISVVANFSLPPGYLLIAPAVSSLTGGWTIALMAMFSYIGDNTTEKTRGMNIVVVDGFFILFGNAGGLLGGYIFKHYGMVIPFYMTVALQAGCFLYVLLMIRESKPIEKGEKHGALFTISNLMDNVRMLKKQRLGDTRLHIILILFAMLVYNVCMNGDNSVTQLFVEFAPFNWDIEFYTIFACVNGIVSSAAVIFVMAVLRKYFGIPDTTIALIATLSTIFMYFGYGIATADWMLYVASAVGILRILVVVCIRAILSCLVDENEIGKCMSIISSMQAITPLLGSVIFADLFAMTSSWWSGLCFVVGSFLMVPVLMAFAYVDVMRRRNVYHPEFEYKPLS